MTASVRARRARVALAVAVALLLVAVVLSLGVGARPIAPSTIVDALVAPDPADADHIVLLTQRIPRTVIGILAGAALALAGTVMQGLTRNPLADPGLLGVNAGASVAVLASITLLGVTTPSGFVWFAFGGAALAAVVVAVIGSRGPEGGNPAKLALTGAAVTAGLTAVTLLILTTDHVALDVYRYWSVGGLTARGLDSVALVAVPIALGIGLALFSARGLDLIALGADTATGLGHDVNRTRGIGILATILLCGGATAIAGPIVFVGLVIPHALRAIVGDDHRWLMAIGIPAGASLLLLADVIGTGDRPARRGAGRHRDRVRRCAHAHLARAAPQTGHAVSVDALTVRATAPVSALEGVRRAARRRRALVVSGVLTLVFAIALLALTLGDFPLSLEQVWRTLWGDGTRAESYVVLQVRAPRLAMALVAGAALGASGALLQSLLGNPLASPDLLGISGGSGVAAIFALLVLGTTGPALALAAFIGGIVVAGFLLLAGRTPADGGYRLIIAGVGVSFLAGAATSLLMVRAKIEQAQTAMLWLTGSLSSTPWWQVLTVAVVGLIMIPAVIASARWLPIVQLGAPTAAGLGVRPGLVRVVTVTAAVVLTAVTCAFLGPISFIALCAPAIARPLLGHASAGIATSALLGAAMLAAADLVAQFAIPGMSVPVGVVTGAIGALFLLWLLATSKGRHL